MKDLFTQAGDLVQAVVQLMQAISNAETQSMRDAPRAPLAARPGKGAGFSSGKDSER